MQNHALYSIAQIRQVETAAKSSCPTGALMRRAGYAAAELALQILRSQNRHRPVLILAGSGDNGGDALEVAALLAQQNLATEVCMFGDATQYSVDAQASLARAKNHVATWLSPASLKLSSLDQYSMIIDGLFGIGLNRPIRGYIAQLIAQINASGIIKSTPVIALDVPSGLNADTGQIVCDDEGGVALHASHTISFIGDKVGLHTAQAKDYAGQVSVASLDIDHALLPPPLADLSDAASVSQILPIRRQDSNKGSYGDVLIIGGNTGMTGAVILAARAALYSGAGRVLIGFVSDQTNNHPSFDPLHPEIMCRLAKDCDLSRATVVIGPGLGQDQNALDILQQALEQSSQLVIDADALNLISQHEALQALVRQRHTRSCATVLTPHPLEAARLLQSQTSAIQADRVQAATQIAEHLQACVILKGSGSIVTDGQAIYVNSSGNPALATAGTGDVLAGICGALLAQISRPVDAARLACFVHGKAADNIVAQGIGPIGMCASELAPAVRHCLNSLQA